MAKKKTKKRSLKKTTTGTKPVRIKFKPMPKITPEKQNITPHPTAQKEVQDFEETLQRQLAGDEQPQQPKRGPGRPRKNTQPEPEPEIKIELTSEVIASALKIPFDLWSAKTKVKEMRLQDGEAAALAEPVKQLIEYYFPTLPPIVFAWLSLAFTSYSIMRLRLLILAEIRKCNPPPPREPSGGIQGEGTPPPGGSVKIVKIQPKPPGSGPTGFPTKKK